MSLVNYSSDEEEEEGGDEEDAEENAQKQEENKEVKEVLQQRIPTASPLRSSYAKSFAPMETLKPLASSYSSSTDPGETSLKLPDASQLLASFDSGEEILAANISGRAFASTKRSELNGSVNGPPKKIPKGILMPSRILPDTAGGSLLPPQLKGRSNVATEDLDRLFTRRRSS